MSMFPLAKDRVAESSSTATNGDFTLAGALNLFRRFQDAFSTNDLFYYCIEHQTANEWEVGLGKLTGATTLNRVTVLANSDANTTLHTFTAGQKRVFAVNPAELIVPRPQVFQARLTLTSGTPITSSDVTGATTVYLTPFNGNEIWLFTSGRWKPYNLAEISLALGTVVSGKNYDIFVFDNAGTLTLEKLVWTDDTNRATALVTQDNIQVKSGATDRRYVGTIRTTSTTATEDSAAKRFCWNLYNQQNRTLTRIGDADSYTYSTATWRQVNANTANQVEAVIGLAGYSFLFVQIAHMMSRGATFDNASGQTGLGVDSTTVNSATGGRAITFSGMAATYSAFPSLGYHKYCWLENSLSAVAMSWFALSFGGLQGFINA